MGGANPVGLVSSLEEEEAWGACTHMEKILLEHTGRQQPSASPGGGTQKKTNRSAWLAQLLNVCFWLRA